MADDDRLPSLERDPVGWVRVHLDRAIDHAERDIEATARARRYHLAQYVARGSCPLGHPLDHPDCGYCANARAVRDGHGPTVW